MFELLYMRSFNYSLLRDYLFFIEEINNTVMFNAELHYVSATSLFK